MLQRMYDVDKMHCDWMSI